MEDPLTVARVAFAEAEVRRLEMAFPGGDVTVHVSNRLPFLSTVGRGWVHYVLVPGDLRFGQEPVLTVSPLLFHLMKYNKANKLMRSKARWWFR